MLSFAFKERFVDTAMASRGNLLFMDSMMEHSHEVTVGCMHIWDFEYTSQYRKSG
jgi:hypothetical protein